MSAHARPLQLDAALAVADLAQARALAQQLEAEGFDGLYTFDGRSDPFLPLALAAQDTRRVTLITAIAVAFARNPMLVAQTANDLQRLSQGRFILGLGSQIKAHIEKRYSMPWSAPAARMREFVLAVKAIWHSWATGETLAFRGEFYTHTLMNPLFNPGPNPHGNPPILVAGVGPTMIETAGEVADGLLIHPFHSAGFLDAHVFPALARGAARTGRDPAALQTSCQIIVAAGRNGEEVAKAAAEARAQIAMYASTPAYVPVLEQLGQAGLQAELNTLTKQGRWNDLGTLIDDDLLHAVAIVDSPNAAAAEVLRRYAGKVDRISPLGYIRDAEIAAAVGKALRLRMGR
ncbi:MAG: TIGR03617 family F420-dependent LLM class oxidoreductase [Proteobacteria bacterium]|nr:TIGR03617 family F420-dependent LLM class oxidoreductase [Pseudomonadota bacterium]HQR03936.1 TIGR03617 family F420-dependent LLM class oxidoreductase [Rhodocyclaceae bacterium]